MSWANFSVNVLGFFEVRSLDFGAISFEYRERRNENLEEMSKWTRLLFSVNVSNSLTNKQTKPD